MKFSDEIILKITLTLMKNVLTKLKSTKANKNLNFWKFPKDFANILFNIENVAITSSINYKLRTQIFEIIALVSFQEDDENYSVNILENIIKNIYSKFFINIITIIIFKKLDKENLEFLEQYLKEKDQVDHLVKKIIDEDKQLIKFIFFYSNETP